MADITDIALSTKYIHSIVIASGVQRLHRQELQEALDRSNSIKADLVNIVKHPKIVLKTARDCSNCIPSLRRLVDSRCYCRLMVLERFKVLCQGSLLCIDFFLLAANAACRSARSSFSRSKWVRISSDSKVSP